MIAEQTRLITLIALFGQTTQLMVDELVQRLRAAGYRDITAAHHPVFENIDAQGTRLTVLAARTGLTHQSMGELVEALERRGYVTRRADPLDGRARLVRLTSKGRRLAHRAVREIREIEDAWLARYRSAGFDGDLRATLESGVREYEPAAAQAVKHG